MVASFVFCYKLDQPKIKKPRVFAPGPPVGLDLTKDTMFQLFGVAVDVGGEKFRASSAKSGKKTKPQLF